MKLKEITTCIEEFAPLCLQEDYDNSGLIVGDYEAELKGCLLCLDVTEEVIKEAKTKGLNLIISHHPLIFGKGIKKLTGRSVEERIIKEAIKSDINIYAAHTNLDNYHEGLNKILCDKLQVKKTKIITAKKDLLRKIAVFCPIEKADNVRQAMFGAGAGFIGNYDSCSFNIEGTGTFRANEDANPYVGEPGKLHNEKEIRIEMIYPVFLEDKIVKAMKTAHPYEEVAYDIYDLANKDMRSGAGLIGELDEEYEELDFLLGLKEISESGCIRHTKLRGKKIKRVAVCTGSGSFIIKEAISQAADILITADMKYHDFFVADNRILIADIGHYESEHFVKELLYNILNKKFSTFAIKITETNTNPVYYL